MPWGGGAWGGSSLLGSSSLLLVLDAYAISENIVRMVFSDQPNWTGLLDTSDASNADLYTVTDVSGIGVDGSPVRPVLVCSVVQPSGLSPTFVDVTVDRPLSHWPSVYSIRVSGVVSISGVPIDPTASSATFYGMKGQFTPPSVDNAIPSRDIAHPDTYSSTLDPLPDAGSDAVLGGIPVDHSGDYAFDEGVTNYKKRVFRRLIVRKDGFPHLPGSNYGVGISSRLKKLGSSSERQRIAADAQSQIMLEPETIACKVTILPSLVRPDLFVMQILVKTLHFGALKLQVPLSTS